MSAGAAAGETVMARLKRETRDLHERIEATAVARAMAGGTLELRVYVGLLHAYRLAHGAVEAEGRGSQSALVASIWDESLSKVAHLEEDLAFLDGIPAAWTPALERGARSIVQELMASLADPSALAGALYVLEGASLGGAFLTPRLRQCLRLGERGTAFFAGHGERTGSHWRAFTDRMNGSFAEHGGDVACAVEGARRTFESLALVYGELGRAAERALTLRPSALPTAPP